ncbi:Rpn family recombination-promoting nuclease/putative transposase [Synechococcus sp. PCC 7336]|uniref:Rpn family recombination-promoting nuclease/putative transposase n=1 Tax=Synechococcus sp. PCC 7336 TaxID=195250 RepID=UPI00035C19B1|nr:Rpn family recombination-promoting nuclease/putative transposase [Synechococcus sp. PCC 7336]
MRTDSIFYTLFATYPASFFQLQGQTDTDADAYRFDSIEVKQTVFVRDKAFRIDGVFVPKDERSPKPVWFCEIQFQPEDKIYRRLFGELFLYLRYPDRIPDWRASVIFPSRRADTHDTHLYSDLLQSPRVTRIYLDELNPDRLPLGAAIAQLTIEPNTTAPQRFQQVMQQTQAIGDRAIKSDIIELLRKLAIEKFPQLSKGDIERMLGLSNLKDTRVYREIEAEVLEQATAEIQAEARRKAVMEIAANCLQAGIPLETIAKATGLSLEQLAEIADRVDSSQEPDTKQ